MFQATKLLRTFDAKFWKETWENDSLLKINIYFTVYHKALLSIYL